MGVVIKALRKKIKCLEDELTKEEELRTYLSANQEETSVELRAAEEKKELEDHFSQLLQKVRF